MLRILLDTSVYGKLIEDPEIVMKLAARIPSNFVVYGSKIIRNELRNTPAKLKFQGKNKRITLLITYDLFVKKRNHNLDFNRLIRTLSEDYWKEYEKTQGPFSNEEMKNDFIVIAIATIYQLDIIVSNDERTLLSEKAINVYQKVNKDYGMKNPNYKKYSQFRKEIQLL